MLNNNRNRFAVLLSCLVFSFTACAALASPCDSAAGIALDTTWKSLDRAEYFRLDVPATGILTVELSGRSVTEDAASVVEILPEACWETRADVLFVERSATRLVLAARSPGVLFFRVSTTAPRFKIATELTEARLVVEDLELDGMPVRQTSFFAEIPFTKSEPEEVEPDPDGLRVDGRRLLATFLTLEVSSVLKSEPEEVEPDPDGLGWRPLSGI